MESLSNFNFLKVFDVKKNSNENDAHEKSSLSTEKSFIINQVESIENEFDNVLIGKESNENIVSSDQQKNQNSNSELNLEGINFLTAEANIKTTDNNNHTDNIFIKNAKDKNNSFYLKKDSSLNNNLFYNKEHILNKNSEKTSFQKFTDTNLENNLLNKSESNFKNTRENKLNSNILSTSHIVKKSKIKSFFQNYFNFTLKKYSKKNISLKKSQIDNFINYTKKNNLESTALINGKSFKFKDNSNVTKEQKNNVNIENITKETNSFNENNLKQGVEKNINHSKENTLDNFDRLKNILDIRSNDMKQRFSHILENNIRMNKNKFEIQLRPENLGKIHITLEITGQNVDININSDNINAIQSLNENNSNLQKMLQNHGMNLNNFNFNGNNNKGSNKDPKKNEGLKNEDLSLNTKKNNNDDDSFMSDKLVYAKA